MTQLRIEGLMRIFENFVQDAQLKILGIGNRPTS